MLEDLTLLDSYGWESLKRALNQRVVLNSVRLVQSKHNRVWIVETDVRPVVVKRFLSGRCGHEFEALLQARIAGLDVPYPLHRDEEYLVMEYVPGEGCDTLVNHMFSSAAAEGIGRWLAQFHSRVDVRPDTKLRGDAVLSNFIMSDDKVFGVDLEEAVAGNPMDDLGQVCASILGSEPFFTPIKFDLCLRTIKSYERASETDSLERVRPFVAKHLRGAAAGKPLFRRTLVSAAKSIEKGWPELA